MALRSPAWASPKQSQFFLPMAVGRMAFSTRLLSISMHEILNRLPRMTNWQIKDVTPKRGQSPSSHRLSKPPHNRQVRTLLTLLTHLAPAQSMCA